MGTIDVAFRRKFRIVAQGDSLCRDLSFNSSWLNYNANNRWIDLITNDLTHTNNNTTYCQVVGGGPNQYRTNYTVDGVWTLGNIEQAAVQGDVFLFDTSSGGMYADRTHASGINYQPRLPTIEEIAGDFGDPDLHIVQFGTNDGWRGDTAAQFKTNIQNRVNDFPDAKQVILVLAWAPVGWNGITQQLWNEYDQAMSEVAATDSKITFVHIPDDQKATYQLDVPGHFSTAGHRYWYEQIMPHINRR